MIKKITLAFAISLSMVLPFSVTALEMPAEYINPLTDLQAMTARSYIVVDKATGEEIISKEKDLPWPPASMTKLVTVLVVLDTKPKLTQVVTMSKDDEVGGSRIIAKAGVKYTLKDLLHATLLPSANNAANAIARSTGLSRDQFVARMNQKAKDLGAVNTTFVEPSGISELNVTTASDFAKIASAAFSNQQIQNIATVKKYTIRSTNNKSYVQTVNNTNRLLAESNFTVKGGKTGFIDESQNNFSTLLRDFDGKEVVVVVLGSRDRTTEFEETKKLALWSWINHIFN